MTNSTFSRCALLSGRKKTKLNEKLFKNRKPQKKGKKLKVSYGRIQKTEKKKEKEKSTFGAK